MNRCRQEDFVAFPDTIAADLPDAREVHAILDSCATRKTGKVRDWLAAHPGWTFRFTPTSSSWLAVEGFLVKLAGRCLKRAIFDSAGECEAAIRRFIDERNTREAKLFKLTAEPDKIIADRKRGFQVLDSSQWEPVSENSDWSGREG